MKKIIISAAVITSLSLASVAFAQSTVTGTLSSGGSSSSSGNTVTGTVGGGNSLTGTVSSPSTGSTGSGGGGGGGNGPIVGSGGGGGPSTTVICPNLPNSLYALPAGYEIINGVCDPIGTTIITPTATGAAAPGIPNTGARAPGVPNTGAGGNAAENDFVLAVSGLVGAAAGLALARRQFAR